MMMWIVIHFIQNVVMYVMFVKISIYKQLTLKYLVKMKAKDALI